MKVPYSWLVELLPGVPDVEVTGELLDSLGLGVEAIHQLPGAPQGAVVVAIERLDVVEGSHHLKLAEVTDGERSYRVVTGADNAAPGLRTVLALPGQRLPGTGSSVSVREMAGVASEGVLCSPRELGLYDHAAGLVALGSDAELGCELAHLWREDAVIELELTPTRADCFSMLGVARDLAAKLDLDCRHPAGDLSTGDDSETGLNLVVEDEDACPRFTLRLIENVAVGPSPLWLQRRLAALGLRPLNNIVDVTNYVTYELGQPSHAYDRDALADGTIVVRRAGAGEKLVVLTEEELTFAPDDLLITTGLSEPTRPIGVAGIIGGLQDSVKVGTSSIALEVAHFDPVTIRRAAKRLGISTDASARFERGVDPNLPPLANARAAQLITQLAGGSLHPGLTQVGSDRPPAQVPFRPSRVSFLMAMDVPRADQCRYLTSLGCKVDAADEDSWMVSAPSWRFDMAIEEDVIEEVSRLHGFDGIPSTVPAMRFMPELRDVTHFELKMVLAGMGFQEAIGYVFSSDDELARALAPAATVRLANPPGRERSVLRTALYPGLISAARANFDSEMLALFEVGRVFNAEESERLGLLVRGPWLTSTWREGRPTDLTLFKGLLEKLAKLCGAELELTAEEHPPLHPGVSATVRWKGAAIGMAGRLHPEVAGAFELPDTYVAELAMPLEVGRIAYADYPRQPYAERDLAVVAAEQVSYATLEGLVKRAAGDRLESVWPFDIYRGRPVPEGSRSVAIRLRFRHPERSLRDDEVDAFMGNVIYALKREGYDIRE